MPLPALKRLSGSDLLMDAFVGGRLSIHGDCAFLAMDRASRRVIIWPYGTQMRRAMRSSAGFMVQVGKVILADRDLIGSQGGVVPLNKLRSNDLSVNVPQQCRTDNAVILHGVKKIWAKL